MIAAADRIPAMTDEAAKAIRGHGPMADRKRVVEFRAMLIAVRDRIAKTIQENKTLEEIVAAKPTADPDRAGKAALSPPLFVTLA
jgi:hypothetical protein